MSGLIENMLDFRGRLGVGITLNRERNVELDKILMQVIAELRTTWPGRLMEDHFNLNKPVNCDSNRIAQLFSNLLNNAIIHSTAGTPVKVNAFSTEEKFELSITNYGDPIPTAAIDQLFQPFYRGEDKSGKNGLGLGLYIASEIARAHGGELSETSKEEETCFTLQIPVE